MKPLFKWTGSKRKMMSKFGASFWPNEEVTRFVDGFYGAGSVTCAAKEKYPNAEFVINDSNTELVSLYQNLAWNEKELTERVFSYQNDYLSIIDKDERKKFYNKIKLAYIEHKRESVESSSQLLFMLKTNFNGWWKVYNYSNGRYATPPGTMAEKKNIFDPVNLKETAEFFREQCIIKRGSYNELGTFAGKGTYFYFDPPYRDSGGYEGDGFTESDQLELLGFMDECDAKGSLVSYSNKDIGDGFFSDNLPDSVWNLTNIENSFTAQRKGKRKVSEIFISNFFENNALFT